MARLSTSTNFRGVGNLLQAAASTNGQQFTFTGQKGQGPVIAIEIIVEEVVANVKAATISVRADSNPVIETIPLTQFATNFQGNKRIYPVLNVNDDANFTVVINNPLANTIDFSVNLLYNAVIN
jgi:hypothetical protein